MVENIASIVYYNSKSTPFNIKSRDIFANFHKDLNRDMFKEIKLAII